ncbi:MAG: hypothetical protein HY069_01815 [Chlamydiia bacterium]|nr:hypothetical protein [Chlamydiia bacterium]
MRYFVWVTLLVLLVAGVIGWLTKPIWLSSYLTSKLNVPVSIGSISVGTTQTTIGDFSIRNVHRYKARKALAAQTTTISYEIKKLFGAVCEIDEIVLDGVFFSVEFDQPPALKNNWTHIIQNMPKPTHREKEVLIRTLLIQNLTVEIRNFGQMGSVTTKRIGEIALHDIDSKEGFPTKELIHEIFGGADILDYLENILQPIKAAPNLLRPFGL